MQIFIGLREIAHNITSLAKGFRDLGHETFTMIWTKNRFNPEAQFDVVIGEEMGTYWPDSGLLNKGK